MTHCGTIRFLSPPLFYFCPLFPHVPHDSLSLLPCVPQWLRSYMSCVSVCGLELRAAHIIAHLLCHCDMSKVQWTRENEDIHDCSTCTKIQLTIIVFIIITFCACAVAVDHESQDGCQEEGEWLAIVFFSALYRSLWRLATRNSYQSVDPSY